MTTMTLACGLLCTQQPATEKPAPILTADQAALQRANQRIKTLEGEVKALKKPEAKKAERKPLKRVVKREQKAPKLAQTYEVTAYTNGTESTGKSAGDPDYGVTASGARTKTGHTIACPPSMAFGTRLNIEGIGVRTCEDRGGAITEGHIDLYVAGVAEAQSFGRQRLKAEILTK